MKWLSIREVVEQSGFSRKVIDQAIRAKRLKAKDLSPNSKLRRLVVRADWRAEWLNTPDRPNEPEQKQTKSRRRRKKPDFGDARQLIAEARQ